MRSLKPTLNTQFREKLPSRAQTFNTASLKLLLGSNSFSIKYLKKLNKTIKIRNFNCNYFLPVQRLFQVWKQNEVERGLIWRTQWLDQYREIDET